MDFVHPSSPVPRPSPSGLIVRVVPFARQSLANQIRLLRSTEYDEEWATAVLAAEEQTRLWTKEDPKAFVAAARERAEISEAEADRCLARIRNRRPDENLDLLLEAYLKARSEFHAREMFLGAAELRLERYEASRRGVRRTASLKSDRG